MSRESFIFFNEDSKFVVNSCFIATWELVCVSPDHFKYQKALGGDRCIHVVYLLSDFEGIE